MRAVLAAGIVVAGLLGTLSPADAKEYPASHATINGVSHGFATFESNGDKFSLCDIRPDGYSIGVQYWIWVAPAGKYVRQRPNLYNYWGSDTCRTLTENMAEGSGVAYRACLYTHASPGGDPPHLVDGTCGTTRYGNA